MNGEEMRFAYADPPYPGQGKRYAEKVETNHPLLIQYLVDEFPDGWALSTSTPALKYILNLCPDDVRVASWTKTFAVFKPNVNPAYCWEPVIFRGGRKRDRTHDTVRDWHASAITLQKGLVGAKPESFCHWILSLLGVSNEDELIDIFPGTGIMSVTKMQGRL